MVDRCDILVANLSAMRTGYPCIGTLMEIGRASVRSDCLVYVVYEAGAEHVNNMFKVHPFIEQNAANVFYSIDDCQEFLVAHIPYLTGQKWSHHE